MPGRQSKALDIYWQSQDVPSNSCVLCERQRRSGARYSNQHSSGPRTSTNANSRCPPTNDLGPYIGHTYSTGVFGLHIHIYSLSLPITCTSTPYGHILPLYGKWCPHHLCLRDISTIKCWVLGESTRKNSVTSCSYISLRHVPRHHLAPHSPCMGKGVPTIRA